jgi:hypothetical protein
MAQDHEVSTVFANSRLAASLSAWVAAIDVAWRHSATRKLLTTVAACVGDRRSGAATMAVAATVALGTQQLRATAEPALWMLPAFVLVWAVGTLMWPVRRQW